MILSARRNGIAICHMKSRSVGASIPAENRSFHGEVIGKVSLAHLLLVFSRNEKRASADFSCSRTRILL